LTDSAHWSWRKSKRPRTTGHCIDAFEKGARLTVMMWPGEKRRGAPHGGAASELAAAEAALP